MQITWLGHGTFEFVIGSGKRLIADPWIEGNPKYPKDHKIEGVDLMIISHGHFDHIHDAVPLAKKFKPGIAAIYEICHWLESKGVENAGAMNKGGTQTFFEGEDQVAVTMTHAVHSCGILDDGKIIYGGEAAGFVLRFADGRSIYFSGDTNVFGDMELIAELYQPDLVILPIGNLFTMGPREAAKACELLGAKRVIPMHWATFPALTGQPSMLEELVKARGTEVWTLQPGKTVEW
jgi:L-ascorbate metabolism protein UlaG (beta-lactamase superfamily)